jgi:hypothetical protein
VCWTVIGASPAPYVLDTWVTDRAIVEAGLARARIDRLIEVWCHADDHAVRERYRTRVRHPGHFDDDNLDQLEEWLASARPLAIGEVVEVDTTHRLAPTQIEQLAARVRG